MDRVAPNFLNRLGARTIARLDRILVHVAAVYSVLLVMVTRRYWSRPVRNVLVRQILFTACEATLFIGLVASLVGVSIVVQAKVWLGAFGMLNKLGIVMVAVIMREIGPLLTNLVVLARSGTAIATELGSMKVNGEVHLLNALGLDPFIYLVATRMLGMAISVFCLSIVFILVSFASGYIVGLLLGGVSADPGVFVRSVFAAVGMEDVFNLLVKTFIVGLATGSICCREGLSAQRSITEVPQATTRAVVRSTATMFLISAVTSFLMYA